MRFIAFGVLLFLLYACSSPTDNELTSDTPPAPIAPEDQVLQLAKEGHGSFQVPGKEIQFRFRDRTYTGHRYPEGGFTYVRAWRTEEGDSIRDILTNRGFYRLTNDQPTTLSPKDSAAYSNSVNSVLYFALVPFNLNDPAVFRKYLGTTTIEDATYVKLQITFQQDGGGKDFEDVFVYWVNQETGRIDFFGYNYLTDGGGARFRKAINPRVVEGILFQDYINFKPEPDNRTVSVFDSLYQVGQMKEVSRILLEDIQVNPVSSSR